MHPAAGGAGAKPGPFVCCCALPGEQLAGRVDEGVALCRALQGSVHALRCAWGGSLVWGSGVVCSPTAAAARPCSPCLTSPCCGLWSRACAPTANPSNGATAAPACPCHAAASGATHVPPVPPPLPPQMALIQKEPNASARSFSKKKKPFCPQLVFGHEELSSLNQHRIMLARQIAIKMLNAGGWGAPFRTWVGQLLLSPGGPARQFSCTLQERGCAGCRKGCAPTIKC